MDLEELFDCDRESFDMWLNAFLLYEACRMEFCSSLVELLLALLNLCLPTLDFVLGSMAQWYLSLMTLLFLQKPSSSLGMTLSEDSLVKNIGIG
jgi:hypothetical protein